MIMSDFLCVLSFKLPKLMLYDIVVLVCPGTGLNHPENICGEQQNCPQLSPTEAAVGKSED